jgi:7,8-dihydropterin-6-yl-methyl-4-(beta-D-ribofuranosyl)aminobenzene 5'-phosphate synthase
MRSPDGAVRPMESIPSVEELDSFGAACVVTTEPQDLHDGMFWTSGEILRVSTFARGFSGHLRRTEDGGDWETNELLLYERFLAVDVVGAGLVVFSAGSHAGIVNALAHASATFWRRPIFAGGRRTSPVRRQQDNRTLDGRRSRPLGSEEDRRGTRAPTGFGDDVVAPKAVGKSCRF